MDTKPLSISFVIPVFNEASRIVSCLERIHEYCRERNFEFEIVVVDDGSSDGTSTVTGKFARCPIRLVRSEVNEGKGAAIRKGVREAQCSYLVFLDTDLATEPREFDAALPLLRNGADIVVGSRRNPASKIIRGQPWYRVVLGDLFRRATRASMGITVSDITCGFKCFRTEIARELFAAGVLNRWVFDAEILFLAYRWGLRVDEVPVSWRNSDDSRVFLLRDVCRSALEMCHVFLRRLLGKYPSHR